MAPDCHRLWAIVNQWEKLLWVTGWGALEEDEQDQSFQVVELCLPPEVPHLLQDGYLMGNPAFPWHWPLNLPPCTHSGWESKVPSLSPPPPTFPCDRGREHAPQHSTAFVWKSEDNFHESVVLRQRPFVLFLLLLFLPQHIL